MNESLKLVKKIQGFLKKKFWIFLTKKTSPRKCPHLWGRYRGRRMLKLKKTASPGQGAELFAKLTRILLEINSDSSGKLKLFESDGTQVLIDMDDYILTGSLAKFVNAGCRNGLLGVIDFDSNPTFFYRMSVLHERKGITGCHRFKSIVTRLLRVRPLGYGESISGSLFQKRLLERKGMEVNSNFLAYVIQNQDDEDVKSWLDELKIGDTLYAFGDIFQEENGNLIVSGIRKDDKGVCRWAIDHLKDSSFGNTHYALMLETN